MNDEVFSWIRWLEAKSENAYIFYPILKEESDDHKPLRKAEPLQYKQL